MLKPVSILALDDRAAALAESVQQRVSAARRLEDLVQYRRVDASLEEAIDSIHTQRQRPDSPLRLRDDISTRELVLVVVDTTGPARAALLETLGRIRHIYEMRRLASFFAVEVLCLLPEVAGSASADDYAAAYGVMKALSGADPKPFDEVWLLDATNSSRVKFPPLGEALELHADAVAGALTFEPEMSGALPGSHPRGMPPVFNAFGFAELLFPREAALQRVEPRFAAELVRGVLLRPAGAEGAPPSLRAKQFVVGSEFAAPLSRIGLDAGQSLFRRFQPKTIVTEKTRNAEEVIAGVRAELKVHRESVQLQNLATLAKQGDDTAAASIAALSHAVDQTLDGDGYDTAIGFLEALLDPLADVRADVDLAPRNLVTEINTATAALDSRVHFVPNTASSNAARKRVHELTALINDQKLVADTVLSAGAAEQIAELQKERDQILVQLPEIVFSEEGENNASRNAAREAEASRLKEETEAKEGQLRELFAQLPRAEQALREALEARRVWLWHRVIWAVLGLTVVYAVPFAFGVLRENLERVNWTALIGFGVYAVVSLIQYANTIAPRVRGAREVLDRLRIQIDATDKAKNAAHNDELQFEYDVAHRRTAIRVLRRTHEAAKAMLDSLRARRTGLEEFTAAIQPASVGAGGLVVSIVDDPDVDAWYDHTSGDRQPFVRDFPISRSESWHAELPNLCSRVHGYALTAFEDLRRMTLAEAAATLVPEIKLAQHLKRFAEISGPRIELRDDDLLAQQTMQRDTTLWMDGSDARWLRRVQSRFPEAHTKPSTDAVRIHALTRVLHFPAYVIGQIDYYRTHYQAAKQQEFAGVPDLLPMELILAAPVRAAYEQLLLGRAVGVVQIGNDGQLVATGTPLGDSTLAAATRLAASDAASLREKLSEALAPHLSVASDVARELCELQDAAPLTSLDRGVLGVLAKRYAALF